MASSLDSWRAWGGASSWGYPLTAELQENGRIVQYYDYGRFEYHPDDPNGVVVQFGQPGAAATAVRAAPGVWEWQRRGERGGAGGARLGSAGGGSASRLRDVALRAGDESHGGWRIQGILGGDRRSGYLGNPVSEPYKIDGVTYQVFERGSLAQRSGEPPAIVPVGKMMVERLRLDTTPSAQGELPVYSEELFTPPMTTVSGVPADPNGEKWVQINITLQYLWAYQGDQVLWQGYISTGTAKFATPLVATGCSPSWNHRRWRGCCGEYYNVPDVPDVLYFTDRGHAIHGTYWHNNFGTPMSHGCVNLPTDVADWMYQWATVGTRVEITP